MSSCLCSEFQVLRYMCGFTDRVVAEISCGIYKSILMNRSPNVQATRGCDADSTNGNQTTEMSVTWGSCKVSEALWWAANVKARRRKPEDRRRDGKKERESNDRKVTTLLLNRLLCERVFNQDQDASSSTEKCFPTRRKQAHVKPMSTKGGKRRRWRGRGASQTGWEASETEKDFPHRKWLSHNAARQPRSVDCFQTRKVV